MTKEEFIEKTKKNRSFSQKTKWNEDGSVTTSEGLIMSPLECKCGAANCNGWIWESSEKKDNEAGFTDFMMYLDGLHRWQEQINESRPTIIVKSFAGGISGGDGGGQ